MSIDTGTTTCPTCAACSAALTVVDVFCPSCGIRTVPAAPSIAGSKRPRRTATIVASAAAAMLIGVAGLAVAAAHGGNDGSRPAAGLRDRFGVPIHRRVPKAPTARGGVPVDGTPLSEPALGRTLAFVVNGSRRDATVTAVRVADGSKAWSRPLAGYEGGPVSTLATTEGVLIGYAVGGGAGQVLRIDNDGTASAVIDTDGPVTPYAFGDGRLFVDHGADGVSLARVDFAKKKVIKSASGTNMVSTATHILLQDGDRVSILDNVTLARQGRAIAIEPGERVVGMTRRTLVVTNDRTVRGVGTDGKERWNARNRLGSIYEIEDLPGGRFLALGDEANGIFRTKGSDIEDVGELPKGAVRALAATGNGSVLAVGRGQSVALFDVSKAPAKELGRARVTVGAAGPWLADDQVLSVDNGRLHAQSFDGEDAWGLTLTNQNAYAGEGYFVLVSSGSVRIER